MLKVFGDTASTRTRKVLMTLAETGTGFEFIPILLTKMEHRRGSYLQHQPFGELPAIDDDGFVLYESRAICRYINDRAEGKLIPRNAQRRALMEQWISIETSNFTPHVMKLIFHHVFGRADDAAALDEAGRHLSDALSIMDRALGASPFVAGSEFTLADVVFMPYFEYALLSPARAIFVEYLHVMEWWSRVSARSTWAAATGKN